MDGRGFVRLAQLRARIATLARGGRFELAGKLLHELTRADLALGLPADSLLRARQAAALAEEQGGDTAGPLIVLAATLLATDEHTGALEACTAALDRATPSERTRIEALARLVGGAAQRRAGRLREARALLDGARGAAARLGESALAGLALCELARVDLAEGQPAAAATCFDFGAEFFRRAGQPDRAVEADVLAVTAWSAAGALDAATERAPRAADAARKANRPELTAVIDGSLAELMLRHAPAAAAEACALAAESAQALPDQVTSRELVAEARLRQVRASQDPIDRARHLEAGIDVALTLESSRAGDRLGALLVALVDDRVAGRPVADSELQRLSVAIASLGDQELSEMARGIVAELRAG